MSSAKTVWLKPAAIIVMLVGLGLGAWALSAPMGVWLGQWEFGRGFQILQAAYGHAPYVTIGCAVAGVVLLVLGKLLTTQLRPALLVLPLVGAAGSGLAWYIPGTYSSEVPPPPIHDVSTDVVDPPQYVDVMPLRADAPNTTVYGEARGMEPGQNARLQQEAYPDLVPQYYEQSTEEVFDRALAAVNSLGWDLVAAVPEEGRIEATDTTFWFRFKDDVVIRIVEENGRTRLDARSLSRVGGGDAGKNASRLRGFLALMND